MVVLKIEILSNNILLSKKIKADKNIIKVPNFILGLILNLSSIRPIKKKQVDKK